VPKPQEELDKQSLARYTDAAIRASREVIASYSTSFGWATKLLKQPIRTQVQNIYGLVRVADEIVDGAAAGALGDNRLEDNFSTGHAWRKKPIRRFSWVLAQPLSLTPLPLQQEIPVSIENTLRLSITPCEWI